MKKQMPIIAFMLFAITILATATPAHALPMWVPHVHSYKTVIKYKTCTEDGYQYKKCSKCGKIKDKKVDYKTGHHFERVEKIATCTQRGYVKEVCSNKHYVHTLTGEKQVSCGKQRGVTTYIRPTGHKWGAWTVSKSATCAAEGQKIRRCLKRYCSASETKAISKKKHVYKTTTTAPTCTKDGSSIRACKYCGSVKAKRVKRSIGHDMSKPQEDYRVYKMALSEDSVKIKSHCKRAGCNHYEVDYLKDKKRIKVVQWAAAAYEKGVPYYWGGHPDCPGFKGNDFGKTIAPDNSEYKRTKKGLDCGGLVCWAFWSAGMGNFDNGYTGVIWSKTDALPSTNLLPGDLGFIGAGSGSTHVGIYMGGGMWAHARGTDTKKINRVVIEHISKLKWDYYRRPHYLQ